LNNKFPITFPFLNAEEINTLYLLNPKGFIKSIPYFFPLKEIKSNFDYIKTDAVPVKLKRK
jgi:hypothetical protein